ncbi:MAG: hypothetical protein ABIH71_02725, partial [Candidatus Omnitrophota bacterium]
MSKITFIRGLAFSIALFVLLPVIARAQDKAVEENMMIEAENLFLAKIRDAFRLEDNVAFFQLYCWDNISIKRKRNESLALKEFLMNKLKDARLNKSVPQSFLNERFRNGIRYYSNLPIIGIVEFDVVTNSAAGKTETIKKPYGYKDGALWFTFTAEEVIEWSGLPDKPIMIIIYSQPSAGEHAKIEGYFSYNISGVDKKKELILTCGYSCIFQGKYF